MNNLFDIDKLDKKDKKNTYDASSIKVLEGLEPVRVVAPLEN